MDLTDEHKRHIDGLAYDALLNKWRFAPVGDPWFQGETGKYWSKRMSELRGLPGGNDTHVSASKRIGWER